MRIGQRRTKPLLLARMRTGPPRTRPLLLARMRTGQLRTKPPLLAQMRTGQLRTKPLLLAQTRIGRRLQLMRSLPLVPKLDFDLRLAPRALLVLKKKRLEVESLVSSKLGFRCGTWNGV